MSVPNTIMVAACNVANKWNIHPHYMGTLTRQLVKDSKVRDTRLARTAVTKMVVKLPPGSVDVMAMMDDTQFDMFGRTTVFVESDRLAEMLMRARIRLEGVKLKLPHPSFSVALPADCGIQPFLVTEMTNPLREAVCRSLSKTLGTPVSRTSDVKEHAVAIYTRVDKGEFGRLSVPDEMMREVAEADSVEKAAEILGTYPAARTLSTEHMAILLKQFRLLCAMCAYVEARPEMLVKGLPSTVAPHDFPDRSVTSGPKAGLTLKAPAGLGTGGGGSKTSHLRSWYFRRYPLKKDMTRKAGMVFVEETVVNEEITPETLKEK